jgi:hypothetical protein
MFLQILAVAERQAQPFNHGVFAFAQRLWVFGIDRGEMGVAQRIRGAI